MRHLLIIIIIMCSESFTLFAADTNAPVVRVDDKHNLLKMSTNMISETYRVRASSSMVLDATGYAYDLPPQIRGMPLCILMGQNKSNEFVCAWQSGKTRYELSKATLRPSPGSKPFEGFKGGDFIMIGICVADKTRKDIPPVWFSYIDVER